MAQWSPYFTYEYKQTRVAITSAGVEITFKSKPARSLSPPPSLPSSSSGRHEGYIITEPRLRYAYGYQYILLPARSTGGGTGEREKKKRGVRETETEGMVGRSEKLMIEKGYKGENEGKDTERDRKLTQQLKNGMGHTADRGRKTNRKNKHK